jgi:phosphoribosylanthranilate isomerase
MIIKVCGITLADQIKELIDLQIDMIGFNFYEPSPRYYGGDPLKKYNFDNTLKVGVFVNPSKDYFLSMIDKHGLDYVQLHGSETPETVDNFAEYSPIIKAFPHTAILDENYLNEFQAASYFLFDTATKNHGGSGVKFDWDLLNQYKVKKAYLLAGGISPMDIEKIKTINNEYFSGVDINSKFEISPGIKIIDQIKNFKKELIV